MEVKWEGVRSVGEYMAPCFLPFPMHISVYTVKEKRIHIRTRANCIRPGKRGKSNLGFVLAIVMLLRSCTSFGLILPSEYLQDIYSNVCSQR